MGQKVDILMHEVRRNASTGQARFSNFDLIKLFNDAQDIIRGLIHDTNGTGRFFPKSVEINIQSNVSQYQLPGDCYAVNSVNSVEYQSDAFNYWGNYKLRQISVGQRTVSDGYYIQGNKLWLSFEPLTGGTLVVHYNASIPGLSPTVGIVNRASGNKIYSKDGSFDPNIDLLRYGEFISIVDRRGCIISSALDIDRYMPESGTITLIDTVPKEVERDHRIALGRTEVSSTHTFLPEEAITLLTTMVERRISIVDSKKKVGPDSLITAEEKEYVRDLFSQNENDVRHTPMSYDNYLTR